MQIARRLKLINNTEYENVSGGQAIELAARKADNPTQFLFPHSLAHYRSCNFSFSGLKSKAIIYISEHERKHNIRGPEIMPDVNNLCAGILMAYTKHICIRTQRAMEFLEKNELLPENQKTLVILSTKKIKNLIKFQL